MSWEGGINEYFLNIQVFVSILSIFIFLHARKLVRSVYAFYFTGVLIGIFASFLIFGYLFQKLIPKGIFTILSLAVCYRMGPPEDERSLNLMEWTLQIISLALIYLINQVKEISFALILFVIFASFWRTNSDNIFKFFKIMFVRIREFLYGPQPRKLLSEQEYLEESRIYTRIELERLRQFCNSQNSKSHWQLVSRLKKPNRMASFITGDSDHVSAMEFSYHSEIYCPDGEESNKGENSILEEEFITDDD